MAVDPVGPGPGTSPDRHTFPGVSASDPAVGTRPSRVARALPLLLAALLAMAAVGTVGSAGCDEPGTYVSTPDGIALVGGCATHGDVDPITDPSVHDPAARRG